jgi:hypothetical protein
MGPYLKLCTDGVMNVAVFKTVYILGTECGCVEDCVRLGTECGCVYNCVQTGYWMWPYLKQCTDWVLNVAVFKTVHRRDTECGCV